MNTRPDRERLADLRHRRDDDRPVEELHEEAPGDEEGDAADPRVDHVASTGVDAFVR